MKQPKCIDYINILQDNKPHLSVDECKQFEAMYNEARIEMAKYNTTFTIPISHITGDHTIKLSDDEIKELDAMLSDPMKIINVSKIKVIQGDLVINGKIIKDGYNLDIPESDSDKINNQLAKDNDIEVFNELYHQLATRK